MPINRSTSKPIPIIGISIGHRLIGLPIIGRTLVSAYMSAYPFAHVTEQTNIKVMYAAVPLGGEYDMETDRMIPHYPRGTITEIIDRTKRMMKKKMMKMTAEIESVAFEYDNYVSMCMFLEYVSVHISSYVSAYVYVYVFEYVSARLRPIITIPIPITIPIIGKFSYRYRYRLSV